MLVVAIGAIGVIGYRTITSEDWGGNFVYLSAAIFMGGYVAYIFLRPYFAARKLWSNPGTQRPLKGTINKLGITYIFPEGEISIEWKEFFRLQKSNDLVTMVRRKDGLLVIFPQHFFKNESGWRKFVKFADGKVAPLDEKGIQRPARSK